MDRQPNDPAVERLRRLEKLVQQQAEDIDDLESIHEELAYEASHDCLTGLLNRRGVLTELRNRLFRHPSVKPEDAPELWIAYIDLDDFKRINDDHGHRVGDRVLQIVGARIVHRLGPRDLAGRLGGDEFVVVLHKDRGAAQAWVKDMQASLRDPASVAHKLIAVSACVGLATSADPHESVDAIIARADRAMYTAKRIRQSTTTRCSIDLASGAEQHTLDLRY